MEYILLNVDYIFNKDPNKEIETGSQLTGRNAVDDIRLGSAKLKHPAREILAIKKTLSKKKFSSYFFPWKSASKAINWLKSVYSLERYQGRKVTKETDIST